MFIRDDYINRLYKIYSVDFLVEHMAGMTLQFFAISFFRLPELLEDANREQHNRQHHYLYC